MSKALIIVDTQNDFCEGGSLAVRGSNQMFPHINNLKKNSMFKNVILTLDWHPNQHISFAETHSLKPFTEIQIDGKKQELWPTHCVADTYGAQLSPLLELDQQEITVRKGIFQNRDSYSGFERHDHQEPLKEKLASLKIEEVYVCGLAFDFCVGSTAIDASKLGYKVTIVQEATRSVSQQTQKRMRELLQQHNVRVVSVKDLFSQ